MPRRRTSALLALALVLCAALTPGCIVGSPLSAFSGEPYGMTIDDVHALQGRKTAIWAEAPFFAAIDIPFAAVLDTGFLPIAAIMWLILPSHSDDEDVDEDGSE
ncbi:MAG: YceK/YidQ family lipoprotein [Planctomycetota bacterium]